MKKRDSPKTDEEKQTNQQWNNYAWKTNTNLQNKQCSGNADGRQINKQTKF